MAYIGKSPSQGVRSRFQYQATAGQSSFSSTDANGLTLTYTDSLYMDVYQNGILLVPGDDYTATTGTTVVLVQSASLDDIIEMVVYDVFSVPDAVSQSAGGTFSGNVTMGNNLTVSGAFTSQGIDDNADATAITISSDENVGIGTTSPSRVISAKSSSITVGNFESTSSTAGLISFSDANTTNDVTVRVGAVGDNLVLQSGGTERMRITSGGRCAFKTTNCYTRRFC